MRTALPSLVLAGSLLLASCTGGSKGKAPAGPAAPAQPVSTAAAEEGQVRVTLGERPRVQFLLPSGWQPVPMNAGESSRLPDYRALLRHTPTQVELMFFGSFHKSQREAEQWYTRLQPEQKNKTAEGMRSRGPRWVQYAVTDRGKRNLVLTLGQGNFVASANTLLSADAPPETAQAAEKALESLRDTFKIEGAAPTTPPTGSAPRK
ncbi:MAG: hypothetical protein ACK47B_27770 [Armatimonadota bacterium]